MSQYRKGSKRKIARKRLSKWFAIMNPGYATPEKYHLALEMIRNMDRMEFAPIPYIEYPPR